MQPGDFALTHASGIETSPEELARLAPILGLPGIVRSIEAGLAEFALLSDQDTRPHSVRTDLLLPVHSDVVPRKDPSRRAVVYLDQCVLSDLAKLETNRLPDARRDVMKELAAALDHAVLDAQTAICIESSFHRQESSGLLRGSSRELFDAAWKFLALRSRGLRLRQHSEIIERQLIQRVALNLHAKVLPAKYLWKTGLSRDPDESNSKTGVLGGAMVVSAAWAPAAPSPQVAHLLERDRASGELGSFDAERKAVASLYRKQVRRQHSLRPLNRSRRDISKQDVTQFVLSEQFTDLPYIYCATRLAASLLAERRRHFLDSDFVDLRFAAQALPYCDLMIVDGDLANRLSSQKLGQQYDVTIFSARGNDLHAAAQWLRARG
jgi:hypothetical protein